MSGRRLAVAAALLIVLSACASDRAPQDWLGVENRTDTPIAVHVNGGWVGTYAAGDVVEVPITGHGGPPYRIEVRSPSSAVLTEWAIAASDAQAVAKGESTMSSGGAVPCGWIQFTYGTWVAPSAGVPAQDPSGTCP